MVTAQFRTTIAATMEDEIDALLSQIDCNQILSSWDSANFDPDPLLELDQYLNSAPGPGLSSSHAIESAVKTVPPSNQPHPCPANSSRFKLATDSDVEEPKKRAVPKNTENTSWAINIWKQWSAHRRQTCTSYCDWPTHLLIEHPTEMNHWLSKFVLEARKGNSDHYPPDTLYCICSGLLRFIRETRPEIIFKDPTFACWIPTNYQ